MKKLLITIGAAAMLPFATFAAWSTETYTTEAQRTHNIVLLIVK